MGACAVVPAYNEAARVGGTVEALLDGVVDEVLVVDDGSKDRTAAVAARAGAHVLRLGTNRGKGGAVNQGLAHVLNTVPHVRWLLLADADLGASARHLAALVAAVKSDRADMAIASFQSRGGFGIVKRTAARGIRWLTGFHAASPLSGQRALTREAAERLMPLPSGWGMEVGMTVRALWAGLRVVEIDVPLKHRETGRDLSGFVHRGKQCAAIVSTLCRLGVDRALARGRGQ